MYWGHSPAVLPREVAEDYSAGSWLGRRCRGEPSKELLSLSTIIRFDDDDGLIACRADHRVKRRISQCVQRRAIDVVRREANPMRRPT
jgi:hypothetical protein